MAHADWPRDGVDPGAFKINNRHTLTPPFCFCPCVCVSNTAPFIGGQVSKMTTYRSGASFVGTCFGLWERAFHDCVGIRKALKYFCQPDARRSCRRLSLRFHSLLLRCRQCRAREWDWLPDEQLGCGFLWQNSVRRSRGGRSAFY